MLNVDTHAWLAEEQQAVAQTYKRAPFVLTDGDGVYLYDREGKAYLDWVAGIAVNALGYRDPALTATIQQAAAGLIHVSNLYVTPPMVALAAQLVSSSFADKVFFCNSGTEANEAAIKFARKRAYESGHTHKTEIVTFSNAFHGRTMGALALTPREKYQKPFQPLMPGAVVAEFNNSASAAAAIGPNTAAVFVEPIQGEGGVHPATTEFLATLRALCDEHGAALIFDEIQCGMGRTGTLWAHEHSGITPDILTAAKPLAAGLPMGAVLLRQHIADALHAGDHGSTFAGGALVASVAQAVLTRVNQAPFLAHVREVGTYLYERLSEINSPLVVAVRGRGLMLGMELTIDATPIIEAGWQHGLLLVSAGPNVLRFVPPLIVDKTHVDTLIDKLTVILSGQTAEGNR
jgi:acetylornithine/N-succinyldiaminopimelate aminotransferase